jgi:hypothetical protein
MRNCRGSRVRARAKSIPTLNTRAPQMGFLLSRLQWTVCALLFFAATVNYLDRQVLGLLAPTLRHSIGWTEALRFPG